jgi:hypothetical protein
MQSHLYKKKGYREGLYNQIIHLISNYQSRFNYPLLIGEQVSTANSITNYCMDHENAIYVPVRTSNKRNVNFGSDSLKLSHLIETRDKQCINATERKIKNAIYSIKADGNKVTQKRIGFGINKLVSETNALTYYICSRAVTFK